MGSQGVVVDAEAPDLPADLTASSWLVADLVTGEVLAAKDPHGTYAPASTLKTLTAVALIPELVHPAVRGPLPPGGGPSSCGKSGGAPPLGWLPCRHAPVRRAGTARLHRDPPPTARAAPGRRTAVADLLAPGRRPCARRPHLCTARLPGSNHACPALRLAVPAADEPRGPPRPRLHRRLDPLSVPRAQARPGAAAAAVVRPADLTGTAGALERIPAPPLLRRPTSPAPTHLLPAPTQ
jgi:hypothetical protein